MKRIRESKIKWNYLALAFAFPAVGMLLVMLISQYEPFGKYSILYSDMYHQYYPFFVAFREALLSGESLLHSWNVGLGMDYLGLISYYLASPLNLLSVLVPEGWLLEFFSLLMPVRLGLASLFFAVFLKEIFRRDDLSISVFGAFYGLCAWALGYQWNIMWLDTFALLPLVILGAVRLLRDKKFILYTVSLFLAVFSNYYIGFFVCIFVFLLFFCYEICRWQGFKRFFQDLCRIALFSALAIGMTAILELPAFAALQTTQSSVNKFPDTFDLNIVSEDTLLGLLSAMRQVAGNMNGAIEPTWKEGLPNLYCGVGTIALAFLYLQSREVKLRDKFCCVALLLFFMISFIIRQLDYIWHGFHFTNMIPYRFSFLFSFVLLYMAYKAWTVRTGFKSWQCILAISMSLCIMACSNILWDDLDWTKVAIFLLFNLSFLLLYVGCLIYGESAPGAPEAGEKQEIMAAKREQCRRRYLASVIMLGVMGLELAVTLLNFGLNFTGTSVTNYPRGTTYTASVIRYMKEREEDNLFYRAEVNHAQTLNDGALNGYNGISAFTSSANVKVTEFMQALGFGAKNTYNRYCYEEASPVADLFLNVKYQIERQGKDKASAYYDEINRFGDAVLLENNTWLPLGFLTEPELAELDFDTDVNGFQFQNMLLQAAAGVSSSWELVSGTQLTISAVDATITDQNSNGYCAYEDALKGSTITYSYVIDRDGFLCVELDFPKRNDVSIWKNGVELYSETMSLPQMLAVGDVAMGDTVEIRATCKNANEKSTLTITAAILNEDRFREAYDILNASTLELTEFSNTRVAGTIDCDRDGLLYTSIPQNGNWYAEVDGEPAQISLVGDAMVAVELEAGAHEVTFIYRNAAFSLGWKISLLCGAVFVFLCYWKYLRKSGGGKYQK